MGLKFEKRKGARINYGFIGATSTHNVNLWYNTTLGIWEDRDKEIYNVNHGYSSHAPCRSVRSFRKMLSKLPDKFELILVSRWIGFNVTGRGSAKV
jgi:hypothetical protein